MKALLKKYASVLYILLITVAVIVAFVISGNLPVMLKEIENAQKAWILGGVGCIVFFMLCRALELKYFHRANGYDISFRDALRISGLGQFYSAITPSATGGQPMQVIALQKLGVPVSISTACVTVKLIGFQLAYILMGVFLAIRGGVFGELTQAGYKGLIITGFALNSITIVIMFLAFLRLDLLKKLTNGIIALFHRLRWVRHPEQRMHQADELFDAYRDSLLLMFEKPKLFFVIVFLSFAQVLAYMSIPYWIYRAVGLNEAGYLRILTLQLMLYIGSSFMPLPGSAGVQESGFCLFFANVFPEEKLAASMVLWRFISFYVLLLIGGMLMIMLRKGKKDHGQDL